MRGIGPYYPVEQTTLYRLVQQHAASFAAHAEAITGSDLPRFIKDEFVAILRFQAAGTPRPTRVHAGTGLAAHRRHLEGRGVALSLCHAAGPGHTPG